MLEVFVGSRLLCGAVLPQHGRDAARSRRAAAVHRLVESGIAGVVLPLEVGSGRGGHCEDRRSRGRRKTGQTNGWQLEFKERSDWTRNRLGDNEGNSRDFFKDWLLLLIVAEIRIAYSGGPRLFPCAPFKRPISLTHLIDHWAFEKPLCTSTKNTTVGWWYT